MKSPDLEWFIYQFEQIYDGDPWYGLSAMNVLRSLRIEQVTQRFNEDSHSILQIVKHMTTWRHYLLRKLQGDASYRIDVDSEDDWSSESDNPEALWQEALTAFENSQNELLECLRAADDGILRQVVPTIKPSEDFCYDKLLEALVQHDVYHIGQLAYLRRALPRLSNPS